MCAKVAQNHETKEGKAKNPSKVLPSHIFCVPLHSTLCHNTAGGSASGAHWKQFIAERGIEYGLQFVTPFLINYTNCLYTKKSSKFLQSYEKTREKPKLFELSSSKSRASRNLWPRTRSTSFFNNICFISTGNMSWIQVKVLLPHLFLKLWYRCDNGYWYDQKISCRKHQARHGICSQMTSLLLAISCCPVTIGSQPHNCDCCSS